MRIDNSFTVPLPAAEAWRVLMDIERIVPCMPGAELTETLDERSYKGQVSVRLGPVALTFKGRASFEEIDEAGHRARIKAQGTDTKGRGGANADVTFRLEPAEAGTDVRIETDLNLSGSVAQYGRGAGMISDLAAHLVGQFAECLRRQLAEGPEAAGPGAAPAPSGAEPAAPVPILGLGLRVLARAILRAIRRLFGRS